MRDPAALPRLAWSLLAVALLWPLGHFAGVDFAQLAQPGNLKVIGGFLASFYPLAHDVFFLGLLREALWQTIAIASVGMLLALLIAMPLAVLTTSALSLSAIGPAPASWLRRGVRPLGRGLTLFLRGIPEVVWALLFVRVFGLGPSAAVLALALTYGGMLAKVFSEILDSTDRRPAQAILAAGGGRLAALSYGLLPMAASELVSYTVYRWECALRAAVVMGLVGAGGLGQLMDQSMKAFNGGEMASILLAFLLLVLLADAVSKGLRQWMDAPADGYWRTTLGWFGGLLLIAGLWACWRSLGLDLGALTGAQALADLGRFIGEFFPPSLKPKLLAKIASGALETFALSLAGTLLAAGLGAGLALFAAGRHGRVAKAGVRFLLNLLRAVPELVWATITVLAAGLGPFAGVLALALHTAGVLGRLYAEALENTPPAAEAALRHSGAPRALAFLYGPLPQVAPQWLAYTLYRWEINIRMAAVMGFVGAGGLGQLLYVELSLFRLGSACTAIGAMLLLALLVDGLSGWLRKRMAC
ncbi:phosphonate ABC transporter, permease protein PhnE [Uliginosibacterium flavum]|uniref:Phosphonate ABC transporter, permease protein PhnE n=2 Tax=Uliginosibacterium flavum TaxID=1396831 RepID=A0ABV2TNH6_9RHOO